MKYPSNRRTANALDRQTLFPDDIAKEVEEALESLVQDGEVLRVHQQRADGTWEVLYQLAPGQYPYGPTTIRDGGSQDH